MKNLIVLLAFAGLVAGCAGGRGSSSDEGGYTVGGGTYDTIETTPDHKGPQMGTGGAGGTNDTGGTGGFGTGTNGTNGTGTGTGPGTGGGGGGF